MLRHIKLAYSCLVKCLGHPLCDLMLMLALIFAAYIVIPHIREGKSEFRPAAKRRDTEMLAATIVIRML